MCVCARVQCGNPNAPERAWGRGREVLVECKGREGEMERGEEGLDGCIFQLTWANPGSLTHIQLKWNSGKRETGEGRERERLQLYYDQSFKDGGGGGRKKRMQKSTLTHPYSTPHKPRVR